MTLAVPDLSDQESVQEELFKFVWGFKHGDNIMYNFQVLQALYTAEKSVGPGAILNKPITIQLVSIIEAILIDFLTRIDQATNHLPDNVDRDALNRLKQEIERKKRPDKIHDAFGEHIYFRRKLYQFKEIIDLLRNYELFGKHDDPIYDKLVSFGYLRNRVHIENYHQNFEDRENAVFTNKRLTDLENILGVLWSKMLNEYRRPW